MKEKEVPNKTIGQFYDSSEIAVFWNQLKGQHMHVGYWDIDDPQKADLYKGAVQFTDYMISHVDIQEGESFIDIGCGYGVPASILAKRKKCRVWGVTASTQQRIFAQKYLLDNNQQHQIQIQVADARNLPFTDGIFDGGWFFESIFHIGHEKALQEAGRVLKSGAELLIADFISTSQFNENEINFMTREVGITSLMSINNYPALLEKAGFNLLTMKDITQNTLDIEGKWSVHIELIEKQKEKWKNQSTYIHLKSFFTKLHEIGEKGLQYYFIKAQKK